MKPLPLAFALILTVAGCGKPAPKPVAAEADAVTVAVPAQDDDLAQKLGAAYPKIRCALAAGVNASPGLYTDAGFADATAYFKAFDIQAKANPVWARKVTAESLAKPCVDAPAAATPSVQSAPVNSGKTP